MGLSFSYVWAYFVKRTGLKQARERACVLPLNINFCMRRTVSTLENLVNGSSVPNDSSLTVPLRM